MIQIKNDGRQRHGSEEAAGWSGPDEGLPKGMLLQQVGLAAGTASRSRGAMRPFS